MNGTTTTFPPPPSYPGSTLIGIGSPSSQFTAQGISVVPDDSTALAEANAQISLLTGQLATAQAQIVGANDQSAALRLELAEANAELADVEDARDVAVEENQKILSRIAYAKAALNRV